MKGGIYGISICLRAIRLEEFSLFKVPYDDASYGREDSPVRGHSQSFKRTGKGREDNINAVRVRKSKNMKGKVHAEAMQNRFKLRTPQTNTNPS